MSSGQEEQEAKKSDDTLGNRFSHFVQHFVSYYLKKLEEYGREAQVGGEGKTGKIGLVAAGAPGAVIGGAIGSTVGLPGPGSKAGGDASSYALNYFGGKKHREKSKRVTEVLSRIDKNESLRSILATAGSDIFRCFECQFAEPTDRDGYWTRAMEKFAVDAINRSINFISDPKRRIDKIDSDLITQSVIFGSSKGKAGIVPLNIANKVLPNPGHTVYKDNKEWNTSKCYENDGLVTMKGDGTADKYYRKKIVGKDASSRYGYRLFFQWELKDKLKLDMYEETKTPREEYRYILKSEEIEKILGDVLSEINKRDPTLQQAKMEERAAKDKQEVLDAICSGQEIKQARKEIWFNMRDPVGFFTGRADKLRDLHQMLQKESRPGFMPGVAAITGLGGIGKSELSRRYAKEHATDYDGNVMWINAETQETLRFSFGQLAEELNIPTTKQMGDMMQERDFHSIVRDVYGYFGQVKSLFIFDNAEVYKDIKEFLPRSLHPNRIKPHILITSRNREWEMGGEGEIVLMALKEFKPEEAETFVKEFLKIEDSLQVENVKELTKELQYFPLALRQAVVCIEQEDKRSRKRAGKGFGIRDYLNKFQMHKRDLLQIGCYKDSDRYTQTVFSTWVVTLERIKEDEHGEVSIGILNIMAYLAPDKVHVSEIFSKLISKDEENLWCAIDLLDRYSMINLEHGVTDIHRLVQEVIRLRLEDGNKEEGVLKRTLEIVNNCRISEESISHVTSVWTYASKYGNLIRDFYLTESLGISTYGNINSTPLHLLAEYGHGKAIEAMLDSVNKEFSTISSEIIDANDRFNRTPLYFAAENGHARVVELLLDNGAKVATEYSLSSCSVVRSPLHIAAFFGHLDIIKILVDRDETQVYIKDTTCISPAILADSADQKALVKFLKPGNNEYLLHAEFRAALICRDLKDLKKLLDGLEENNQLQSIVNSKIGEWTPLHLAAFNNWPEIVDVLLRNGARIRDSKDSFTPLHAASSNGHLDVVKLLILKGAHPTEDVNEDGWTSLHSAAQKAQLGVIQYFIDDFQVNIHVTDKKGDTPLHTAAFHGKNEVVKFLLDKGANIDAANSFGARPLFLGAMNNNREVFEFLLNKGAKLINTTDDGTLIGRLNLSVLHIAAVYNDPEMIEDLIKRGVDKDIGKDDSLTPLHLAAFFSSSEAVECLVRHGADKNACVKLNEVLNALMNIAGHNALGTSGRLGVHHITLRLNCLLELGKEMTPGYIWELFNYSANELLNVEQRGPPGKFVPWNRTLSKMQFFLANLLELPANQWVLYFYESKHAVFITGAGVCVFDRGDKINTDLFSYVLYQCSSFICQYENNHIDACDALAPLAYWEH